MEPLPAENRRHVKKPGVIRQVADQSFGSDFLSKINLGIGVQNGKVFPGCEVAASREFRSNRPWASAEVKADYC
jgi:hypothetical protein